MKVGVKVHLFNWKMRQRRVEMELSQRELAKVVGFNADDVGRIERLLDVPGNIDVVNGKLARVADALEIDFDVLFPQDYLAMLQTKKLPRQRSPYLWCREVSFEELTAGAEVSQLPSPGETVETEGLYSALRSVLSSLPEREQCILQLRYGLTGGEPLTLKEVGKVLGITQERVRQVEGKALRRLRHPVRLHQLKEWIY